MKKLIFTILTTITILGVNAQGNNLQFNRALFEEFQELGVSICGEHLVSSNFTVPNDKVWKITSLNAKGTSYDARVYISKTGTNHFFEETNTILWLPSGNYDLKVESAASGTCTVTDDIYVNISGVEFNIVP